MKESSGYSVSYYKIVIIPRMQSRMKIEKFANLKNKIWLEKNNIQKKQQNLISDYF